MGYRLGLLVTVGLLAVWLAPAEDIQGDGMRPQHYGNHHHGKKPDRIRYWDLLLNNPRGAAPPSKPVEPSCQALGGSCPGSADCCSGECSEQGKCCEPNLGADCSGPATCCSGGCVNNQCCQPSGLSCPISGADCCSGQCSITSTCCDPLRAICLTADTCCDGGCNGGCCQPIGQSCPSSSPEDCCSQACNNVIDKCCQPSGETCPTNEADCCSGKCSTSSTKCCNLNGVTCDNPGSNDITCCSGFCQGNGLCNPVCFAANTMVHIEESPTPIPIQELQTGQHVLCMDTTEDMRLPTKAKYCKMLAWLHANSVTYKQSHIEYLRPNGAKTTLKLAPSHFMVRLTSPDVTKGSTAASLQDFGRFESVAAMYVRAGDILAVLTDETDPMAGFTAVTVEATATEDAEGLYTPLLESPYIIADGVVVPSNINQDTLVAVPEGMDGAKVASHHYLLAPVYMRPAAPGLAGKDAHSLVPDAVAIDEAMRPFVKAGKVLNYTALREWWLPRHQAWKADPTKVTRIDEVLAWLTSDAAWQPRTAEPHKEQWIVEEKGAKPALVQ